jgi:hypothetical protein
MCLVRIKNKSTMKLRAPSTRRMKSPRIAAALAALPMLFALIGIILAIKKASYINISLTNSIPQLGTLKINQVVSFGNTQFQVVQMAYTLNGNPVPIPNPTDLPTISIKSACPNNKGAESCSNGGGSPSPPTPDNTCVPSSAWALIVVNQLFASLAIIIQTTIAIALCIGKGSRMIHQILGGIAAIALLISVVAVMNVPARLFQVCIIPSLQQSSPTGSNFIPSVSYTFDVGGRAPTLLQAATLILLLAKNRDCNRFDPSRSRAAPRLIASPISECRGKPLAA